MPAPAPTPRGVFLCFLLTLPFPSIVLAQGELCLGSDEIQAVSLTLTANFNTVQAHLEYACDDNMNGQATVRYWKTSDGSSLYDVGHPLVRDAARADFNGVVFWLQEGTNYTVQVTVSDPDGVIGNAVKTASITTRTTPTLPSNPPTVWVATNGSDATGCGSSSNPCSTITKAHSVLSSGGQIRLKPGSYSQTATLTADGTSGSPYSLVGDGAGGGVVIDGSVQLASGWSEYTEGGSQVDYIYALTPFTMPNGMQLNVVVQGGSERLHRRTSLTEMTSNPSGWPVGRFWHDSSGSGTLYVRLANAGNPNVGLGNRIRVSKQFHALRMQGTNWHIKNIATQFHNDAPFNIGGGTATTHATQSVVDSCSFTLYGRAVVMNAGTDGMLVQDCTFSDPKVDTWHYDACKGRAEEGVRGVIWQGQGCVIRRNVVTGTFDGIVTGGNACLPLQSKDSDCHDNIVAGVCDDGLEFDQTCGINLSAWSNWVSDANHGFSPNPVYVGPLFMLYNEIVDSDGAGVKNGAACNPSDPCYPCASNGWIGFYHNTFTSSGPHYAVYDVGNDVGNQQYRNNILVGTHAADTTVWAPFVVRMTFGDEETFSFDHDLVYLQKKPVGQPFWRWGPWPEPDYYYSVGPEGDLFLGSAQSAALGWEEHGVYGNPAFTDTSSHDYTLTEGSPAIDIGDLIDGINTPYNTVGGVARYEGSAPDAGAREYEGSSIRSRPLATMAGVRLSVGRPEPNPSRDGVSFVLENPVALAVDARVFDVTGRLVRTLIDQSLPAGRHVVRWDGTRNGGSRSASGIYFLRVRSEVGSQEARIVLVR